MPATAFGAAAMSASVYGSPSVRSARIRAAMSLPSSFAPASHGYAGMFESGTNARGSSRCRRCHSSEYLPPIAREIRARALGAPLERAVVHRFGGHREMTVALRFGAQRANHLRVAQVTALAHVDVLAGEAQRIVRLNARRRTDRMRLNEQRHDFRQAAERHHDERQDAEQGGVLLDRFEVLVAARHGALPVSRRPATASALAAARAREWEPGSA